MLDRALFLRFIRLGAVAAIIVAGISARPAHAASIVVDTDADNTTAGDAFCTLREAITNADADSDTTFGDCTAGSGPDTITFAGNYTITLGGLQLPAVTSIITIQGQGAANTIIQADASPHTATNRIFEVGSTGNLSLDSLTVRHGRCTGICATNTFAGAGIYNAGTLHASDTTFSGNFSWGFGGGIYNLGTLTVTGSTFSSNDAEFAAGAIFNDGISTVSNSSFSGNIAADGAGGIYNGGMLEVTNSTFSSNDAGGLYGGAIENNGTLEVTNSTFSGNDGGSGGGGIDNNAALTVTNSTFSGNSATNGGGIYNDGTLEVSNSTFLDNDAEAGGGGISSQLGTVSVTDSTLSGNTACCGGGIYHGNGTLAVSNSTFSGNSVGGEGGGILVQQGIVTVSNSTLVANSAAFGGGGISIYGTVTVINSTISGNTANTGGGGIFNLGGTLNLANTIIANSTGDDCASPGTIGTHTRNLVEDGTCSPFLSGDPYLGPLADNGGPTQTMALLSSSPAIDAGNGTTCANSPVDNLDQRGVTRPLDGNGDGTARCDIGAFEKAEPENAEATTTTITADTPDPSTSNQNVAVHVTVSGGSSTPTGTVTVTGGSTNCVMNLSAGTGSCSVKFGSTGSKTLTATYNGDDTHAASSDTEPHNVWLMKKFVSQSGNDGWILESTETSGVGGSMNATATTVRVGDDAGDRQYRSILSFNSADLPDAATIKRVVVYVKRSSLTGTNPFSTHGGLKVDIKKPYFGAAVTLGLSDFQTGAGLSGACTIGATAVNSWHKCTLAPAAFQYVNKFGITQLRLRFATDDNDDLGADVLNLFSGNAISANRPYLIVWYLP